MNPIHRDYTIVWSGEVIRALHRLRIEDPGPAKSLIAAILALADDPYPDGSNALGGTDLRHLRLGDQRIVYEVSESTVSVHVLTVGVRRH